LDETDVSDDWVFLMGRPPMGAALTFIRESSADGHVDLARLSDEWRAAHSHIRRLEMAEAGVADDPPVEGIPEALRPLEKKVDMSGTVTFDRDGTYRMSIIRPERDSASGTWKDLGYGRMTIDGDSGFYELDGNRLRFGVNQDSEGDTWSFDCTKA
jgi:hypothetical protein